MIPGILRKGDPVNKLKLPGVELTAALPLVFILLSIFCINLFIENRHLRIAVAEFDNRYIELLSLKLPDGKTLASKVVPGSVGVLRVNDDVVGCAILKKS